jgi:hypothetical protein
VLHTDTVAGPRERATCRARAPCHACHAASMPRHARQPATPRHTNRSSKKKKKIEARDGAQSIHLSSIHSFYTPSASPFPPKGRWYDVTSASLAL